jgi:asparagine synthase (glutamine-hydrolysing)
MCGIAALLNPRLLPHPAPELVVRMMDAAHYRGPDDCGMVAFQGRSATPVVCDAAGTRAAVNDAATPASSANASPEDSRANALACFGHRRLSIVDLSATGHQPMSSSDSRLWITYNGEIYNYIELREELRTLGHAFATQSDTEVILAAYRQWGKGCLERFNGMFALVLLDRESRTVLAARDRFGVKPLYYWMAPDGTLALASEIKQFSVLPGWRPRLNGQRAYDFLNWGVLDHTDETLFQGVFQVRGGEVLELDLDGDARRAAGNRLPLRRWYELRPRSFHGSFSEASRQFRALLLDAVRLELRADVVVGSCLSGGLDSSSIVCLMSELLQANGTPAAQKTFSAGASVRQYDERDYAEEVARKTGTQAFYSVPESDGLFASLDKITWHQDEPFGSSSIYAQWDIFELAARNGVKVMLDGQGADEQLAGYDNYYGVHLGSLFRSLKWGKLWQELEAARSIRAVPRSWLLKHVLNNLLPESLRQPLRRLGGYSATNPSWLDLERLDAQPRDPYLASGQSRAKSVRDMSTAQVANSTLQMLLHWEDRNSMAHSVEARVPFLDHRLVEFVLGLPDDYKLSGGTTKLVLREALRDVLPERVRMRVDKLGFVTPEEVWLREQRPDLFRKALRAAVDISGGMIKDDVLTLLEQMIEGRQPFSHLIWRVISFGSWMKVFSLRS